MARPSALRISSKKGCCEPFGIFYPLKALISIYILVLQASQKCTDLSFSARSRRGLLVSEMMEIWLASVLTNEEQIIVRCSQKACFQDTRLQDAGCCSPAGCPYIGSSMAERSLETHQLAKRSVDSITTIALASLGLAFGIILVAFARKYFMKTAAAKKTASESATAGSQTAGESTNLYAMSPPQHPSQQYPIPPGSPLLSRDSADAPSQSPPPPQPAYFDPSQPDCPPYTSQPVGSPPSYKDVGNNNV